PRGEMDSAVRRSAASQRRSGRLGGTHPVCRDTELCPTCDGKPSGLSCAVRKRRSGADAHGGIDQTGFSVTGPQVSAPEAADEFLDMLALDDTCGAEVGGRVYN